MNCENCPRRDTCKEPCATISELADVDRVPQKDWQILTPHVVGLDDPDKIVTIDTIQPASAFPEYEPSYWVFCELWTENRNVSIYTAKE